MDRSRSLESGVILCRLNHELFPDPGSPTARTTTPLDARGAGGTLATAAGAAGSAADALAAAAAGCCDPELRLPRPPRPRRRRGRRGCPAGSGPGPTATS